MLRLFKSANTCKWDGQTDGKMDRQTDDGDTTSM